MIDQAMENFENLPFFYKRVDTVLISDNPIVLDLFFREEINGLVLKNFSPFFEIPENSIQSYVEIMNEGDLQKLKDFGFNDDFSRLLFELLEGLQTTLLGVQVTKPMEEMCPSFHVDKLPLRLVQCLDGLGTTLLTSKGEVIETERGDLILLKGEMWKSKAGALRHRSPDSTSARRLLRIDFLD